MKKLLGLVLALVLVPSLAGAAMIETGNRYFLPADETAKGNLYVASGNTTIAGTVNGDLYVAGGTILISGEVRDDLVVFGGSVTVTGRVDGDLRVVGGNAEVTGNVTGDVFVIGGSLSDSGKVAGSLDFIGGMLNLNDGAIVGGDVTYRSDREANISPKAIVGGKVTYDDRLARSVGIVKEAGEKSLLSGFAALFGVWLFLKLLMLLFASLVFYWLFLPYLNSIVTKTLGKPLHSLGYGFIALVVTPALALVLMITVIGLPLAFLIFLFYFSLIVAAKLAAGTLIGVWADKLITKRSSYRVTWQAVVGGTIVFFILGYVPFIGWLVACLVVLAIFGAIIDILYRRWLAR